MQLAINKIYRRIFISMDTGVSDHGIEIIGVDPIPGTSRIMGPWKMTVFWSMASASALTPLIGYLLYPLGLIDMLIAISIAFLIGFVPVGIFSEMGRTIPVPAMIISRKTLGYASSSVMSLIFTFVNLGWFGLNDITGGLILASVTSSSPIIWISFMAIVQIMLVLFGAKYLEKFYRYTAILLVFSYGILTYLLFRVYRPDMYAVLHPSTAVNWGSAIGLVLAFSILAWAYKVSTISRFARKREAGEPALERSGFFMAPSIGIIVPVYVMGSLGLISEAAAENWNLAAVRFSGLGSIGGAVAIIASIGASLAIIHTNSMNLYPATADLLSAIEGLFNKRLRKFAQPISTAILGTLGAVLAYAGILNYASGFLNLSGSIIFPFTFVLIADWFMMNRHSANSADFYSIPKNGLGNVNLAGISGLIVGVILNLIHINLLNALFLYVPQDIFGSLAGTAVFILVLKAVQKKQAAQEENRSDTVAE
ncbi:purine-cytosine permease related protein [Thermoplasma acidophilum]|uniref:Purine-cytosine permease related protein n=2 Tax=Thermoplasma acidophilum TaxID=2303 RepID=Q9HIW3_THEAC|nr:purine-cytosine permease related protein [Thermoplasma acidophilum]